MVSVGAAYNHFQIDRLTKDLSAINTKVAATRVELKSDMQALKSDMKTLLDTTNKRIDALHLGLGAFAKDDSSVPAAPLPVSSPSKPTTHIPKNTPT